MLVYFEGAIVFEAWGSLTTRIAHPEYGGALRAHQNTAEIEALRFSVSHLAHCWGHRARFKTVAHCADSKLVLRVASGMTDYLREAPLALNTWKATARFCRDYNCKWQTRHV